MSSFTFVLTTAAVLGAASASPIIFRRSGSSGWGSSQPPNPCATSDWCPSGWQQNYWSNMVCTFDDIPQGDIVTLPGVEKRGLAALTGYSIPTPYCGLYFQSFLNYEDGAEVIDAEGIIPGIIPHSGTDFAGTSTNLETTTGESMITVNYAESTTVNFEFVSTYYGCMISVDGSIGDPVDCTITFTGYQSPEASDNTIDAATEVCAETVEYGPTGTDNQMMAYHGATACKGLPLNFLKVTFSDIGTAADSETMTIAFIDDFTVNVRDCSQGEERTPN